jgi:heparin binding hemagglutinin HbhA
VTATNEVKKYADTTRAQFVEQWTEAQKPLFAVVGAYDVAFEQARQIPTQVRRAVEELPEQVKSLRGRVEGTATQLQDQAVTVYGELAERGERVYAQLRRQPVVQQAVETAEKAADTAETAVDGAVDTAETAGETVKQGGRDTSAAAKKALAKAAEQVEETGDAAAATAKQATATAANSTKSVADKAKNSADKAVDAAEQATDTAADKAADKAEQNA